MKGTSFSQAFRDPILKENDQFLQGFHCFINYWELKPSQISNKLQELALHKIDRIATFVPWSHFENDIHHSLAKFLRAAMQANIKVELLVLPELGVNFPFAGIPKELIKKPSLLAQDRSGQMIYNTGVPHVFPLLSFSSPEVLKAFGNFLLRLAGLLLEFQKEHFSAGKTEPFCDILISSAFSNYLRNATLDEKDHGDFSVSQVLAFKEFLNREYKPAHGGAQPESYEVFKANIYEEFNRHRYLKFAEDQLVEKTQMIFARKLSSVRIKHIDLLNVEAGPEHRALHLVSEALQYPPAFDLFYQTVTRCALRGEIPHFPSSGIFRRLSTQQKAFLFRYAEQYCGNAFVHLDEFISLRSQLQLLSQESSQMRLVSDAHQSHQVTYVASSKYLQNTSSFQALKKVTGKHLQIKTDLGYRRNLEERMIFIDPKSVVRLVDLVQALSAAQKGKVVALPAPMRVSNGSRVLNYLPDAFEHLEKFQLQSRPLRIKTGLSYDVYESGLGYLVLFDANSAWFTDAREVNEKHWTEFFQSILGLAEFRNFCAVTNSAIEYQIYNHQSDSCFQTLILFNPTESEQDTNIVFSYDVVISENDFVGKNIKLTLKPFEIRTVFCQEASMSDISMMNASLASDELEQKTFEDIHGS